MASSDKDERILLVRELCKSRSRDLSIVGAEILNHAYQSMQAHLYRLPDNIAEHYDYILRPLPQDKKRYRHIKKRLETWVGKSESPEYRALRRDAATDHPFFLALRAQLLLGTKPSGRDAYLCDICGMVDQAAIAWTSTLSEGERNDTTYDEFPWQRRWLCGLIKEAKREDAQSQTERSRISTLAD